MDKIKIAIVDDQQLFRNGVTAIINTVEDFQLLNEAESALEFLNQLSDLPVLPDIVLLDMSMPGINGIELNEILHKNYPSVKVLVVTAYDLQRFIIKMVETGASGFLSKNCDAKELILAIRTIAKSGFYFSDIIMKALQAGGIGRNNKSLKNINSIPIEFTKREKEIITLICKEYTTEEIAAQFFLSVRTVEGHRLNLLAKTGCKNIAGLVIFAIKNGLFTIIV